MALIDRGQAFTSGIEIQRLCLLHWDWCTEVIFSHRNLGRGHASVFGNSPQKLNWNWNTENTSPLTVLIDTKTTPTSLGLRHRSIKVRAKHTIPRKIHIKFQHFNPFPFPAVLKQCRCSVNIETGAAIQMNTFYTLNGYLSCACS